MEGPISTFRFVPRALLFAKEEEIPFVRDITSGTNQFRKGSAHALRSTIHYGAVFPPRALAEIVHVSNCAVDSHVADLKQSHGISVGAVLGNRDRLISAEATLAHSEQLFDAYEVIDAGHLLLVNDTEKAADVIIGLANGLR